MKSFFFSLLKTTPSYNMFNIAMLFFRMLLAMEMIIVHGLKKVIANEGQAEIVPNPLHLPEIVNQAFATTASLILPLFVIVGLFTRPVIILIVSVPLTGYFIVHGHDSLLLRDVPFMYSIAYLLVFALGPGRYSIDYFLSKPKSSLS